jgi:3-dehydrosphinganine reductase
MSPDRFFAAKNVVITGGSSGIGRCLALALAPLGANLLLIARRPDPLEQTVVAIRNVLRHSSQVIESAAIDIREREAIFSSLAAHDARHPVDVLINCAGIACAEYVDRTPPETFEQIIEINYLGAVWASLALIPAFKKRQRGTIVNVASLAGVLGFVGYAAYAPSKFALVGFSEVLRNELRADHINVHLLLPPDTDTPQLAAENLTKPRETRAIAAMSKTLEPEVVARSCLRGVAAGRYCIVPGWDASLSYLGARHFPGISRWLLDRVVAASRAKGG